jgi:hypothetical protein
MITNTNSNFHISEIQHQKKSTHQNFISNLLTSISSSQNKTNSAQNNNKNLQKESNFDFSKIIFAPKIQPKKTNLIPSPLNLNLHYKKRTKNFFLSRNKKIPLINLEEKEFFSYNKEENEKNEFEFFSDDSIENFDENENNFEYNEKNKKIYLMDDLNLENCRKDMIKIKNDNLKKSIGSIDDTSCDSEQNKKIIMDGLQINNNKFDNNNNKKDYDVNYSKNNNNNNNNKITILSVLEKYKLKNINNKKYKL